MSVTFFVQYTFADFAYLTSLLSLFLRPHLRCLPCRRRKTKCDGAKPSCERCTRLKLACSYDPPERTPQTVRLQTKIRKLEIELGELEQRPSRMTQRVSEHLSGSSRAAAAAGKGPPSPTNTTTRKCGTTRPFVPLFPVEGPDTSAVTNGRRPVSYNVGAVAQFDLLEGYGTSVPRDTLDATLCTWESGRQMPPQLSDYLCVEPIDLPISAKC